MPEELINTKETEELQSGKIERIQDDKTSSPADLQAFLKEQFEQAKVMLKGQSEDYKGDYDFGKTPDRTQKNIERAFSFITAMEENQQAISIEVLRQQCAKLTEIVGGTITVDEQGKDQFGQTQRPEMKGVPRDGYGYFDYKKEGLEGVRGQVDSALEREKRAEDLKTVETNPESLAEVKQAMREEGTFTETVYGDGKGPTLILLPEIHNNPETVGGNTHLLTKTQDNLDFLGSEGLGKDVSEDLTNDKVNSIKKSIPPSETIFSKINEGKIGISSIGAKVIHPEVKLVGVEELSLSKAVKNKDQRAISLSQEEQKKGLQEMVNDIDSGKVKITPQQMIKMMIKQGGSSPFTQEVIIKARNTVWLQKLQDQILYEGNQPYIVPKNKTTAFLESWGMTKKVGVETPINHGIATLSHGARHAEDITARAGQYGFGRVIEFRTKGWDKPITSAGFVEYAKKQMGIDITK
ncbi:MAG: hypothetical protein WCJ84_01180 [Candidatus Peregrinibacteria bacterium]